MVLQMEEARSFLIEALRQPNWNQVSSLATEVGKLKARAHVLNQNQRFGYESGSNLEEGETSLINELIWSFIIQGILVPGLNDCNQSWPFLRLTDYGRRCISEKEILPHDPDGYLRDFRNAVPSADPAIAEYLTESLQCFLRGLNRAAAVMLGAASEKAVLLLIDSYTGAIADETKRNQAQAQVEKSTSIFRKYEVFDKQYTGIKAKLPKELAENSDSLLRGVFDLIRNSRNEAGHPAAGTYVTRDTNYSHLRLFIPYCQRIYFLIDWFESNQV